AVAGASNPDEAMDGHREDGSDASLPPTTGDGEVRAYDSAYTASYEHLCDEICRLDHLIRAQTRRWHHTIAAAKPPQSWGMVHVTDAEIEAYLTSSFIPPHELSGDLDAVLADDWQRANDVAHIIASRRRKTPAGVSLRLVSLQTDFGLSRLECDALLLCIIPELDSRYRRLFSYLQDDASRTRPTIELITQILLPVAREALDGRFGSDLLQAVRAIFAPTSRLVASRFVVVGDEGGADEPLPLRPVRADDRMTSYLLGGDGIDARLRDILVQGTGRVGWQDLVAQEHQIQQLAKLSEWWRARHSRSQGRATLLFHGAYGSGRLSAARAFCGESHIGLLVADVDAALRATVGWEQAIDLCYREARLGGMAIYWRRCELLFEKDQPAHRW